MVIACTNTTMTGKLEEEQKCARKDCSNRREFNARNGKNRTTKKTKN
jgi:hypothetical protein